MKKRKVMAILLSGVMMFSQPLMVLAAEEDVEDVTLVENTDGEDTVESADETGEESLTMQTKELDTMAVFGKDSVADVYVSDVTEFPAGYSIEVNAVDGNEKCQSLDAVRGKNLDVKLGFEMKAYDGNKNQIMLSDDNVVKIYIEDLGDVSFFGEASLYHEKQDGSWEVLDYELLHDDKGDFVKFSGKDFGVFLFGCDKTKEEIDKESNKASNDDLSVNDAADNVDETPGTDGADTTSEETDDLTVNDNKSNEKTKTSFDWSDIIRDQVVKINVSGEKEFPEEDSLQVAPVDNERLTTLEAEIGKIEDAFSLNMKICGSDGVEDSMDESYIVDMNVSNIDAFKDAKLYHQALNGEWSEVGYSVNGQAIKFETTELGNCVFVLNMTRDETNDDKEAEPTVIPEEEVTPTTPADAEIKDESKDEGKDDAAADASNTESSDSNASDNASGDNVSDKKDVSDDKADNPDSSCADEDSSQIEDDTSKENGNKNTADADNTGENGTASAESTESAEPEAQTPKPEITLKNTVFTYEDDDVSITAEASPDAGIPETAVLNAVKLKEGSDAYNAAMEEVKSSVNLKDKQQLLFIPYDVYFTNADQKIEPEEGKVNVKMAFKEALFGTSPSKNEMFAAHIKSDGVVEHIENTADDKDTVSFDVNSFSVMGPAMIAETSEPAAQTITDKNVTPIIIDDFNATFVSGASLRDGKYVWNPSDPVSDHIFMYRVDYTMSGTFSTNKGAFKLELPLHILKDRDGNWADSFDCPYQLESEVTEGENPDFVYTIDEENNKAIIYNYAPYPTGEAGYIEFYYSTNKTTLYYTDMGGSTKVHAKMYATNDNSTVTAEAEAKEVYIDTHATISYTQKKMPYLYKTWNSSWGDKPADADDYLYLVWTVRSYINKNTSPYTFSLDDTFTDIGGSVVGYKFAGQTTFTQTNHIENVMYYGDRYDYVLTRHSKQQAQAAIEASENRAYKVHNDVIAMVSPIDRVDPGTTAKSSKDWWYEEPRYTPPNGHFWSEKYGLYGGYHIVRNSEDVTDYTLQEFRDGDENEINHLRFYTYCIGYPYPWTLGNGADGTVNDAINGLYGQKKVNYSFSDDTFYVEGKKLDDADYNLASVKWEPTMRTATFDQDTYTFLETPIESFKDEDNIDIFARIGTEWKQVAKYDLQTKTYKNINEAYVKSASGDEIFFKDGAKGVRFTCTNGYYKTLFDVYPDITLNRTSNTVALAGTTSDKIRVSNDSHFIVTQNGKTLYERIASGTDYVQRVIRESEIKKDVVQTKNMKRDRRFDVTWRINVQEKYTDNNGLHYIFQQSGKFYDLLPAGGVLNTSSITVSASGADLELGEYSYETIDNYRNSGRTVLVITIPEPTKDKYYLTYQTSHSYDSINDYGKNLLNSVAYETGNDKIGEGFPDNGGNITDKEFMTNLDDKTDAAKFLYAEARYSINVAMAAATGLKKQIKNSTDKQYSYETTVRLNEDYSYRIRLRNDAETKSKDIVFFDSLENFYQKNSETAPTITSDWKGTLTGVNVNNLVYKNISPVVYLSKIDSMNMHKHHDLNEVVNGENVWIKYDDFASKYGINKATAIAIDASIMIDGKDFVMSENESVSFDIYMKAPNEDKSGKTDPITYNNIYVCRTALRDDGEDITEVPQFYHQDYTKAHYRVAGDFHLRKVDATDGKTPVKGITYKLSGTSDYGTEYGEERVSNKNGDMAFESIEKGTYELREVNCSDDWQLNTETYIVKINEKGKTAVDGLTKSEEVYIVSDKPRIHTDIVFLKYNNVSGGMVQNAKFRLSGTSDYGNEYLMYAKSNEIGRVDFENVELGTYELAEIEAPDGYIQKKDPWKVKVDERGVAVIYDGDTEETTNAAGYYTLINEPYHSVRFVKSSTYGDNIYLEGAEFSLTGISDYGTNVDMTAVSGKAEDGGLVVFTGLEPGTYTLKETKAPAEHDIDERPYTVVVKKDGTFTISGLNKIKFGSKATS